MDLAVGNHGHRRHRRSAFAEDLELTDSGVAAAVGSRKADSADAFADHHGIATRHGSYEELANDPDVDVVYVATPHPMHHANARLALEAGKPVVVEKPFTMNAGEARDLVALARERGSSSWKRCGRGSCRTSAHLGVAAGPRRRRHRHRRPRAVVRRGPGLPAVRAGARRRCPPRPGDLPRVVRLDGARRASTASPPWPRPPSPASMRRCRCCSATRAGRRPCLTCTLSAMYRRRPRRSSAPTRASRSTGPSTRPRPSRSSRAKASEAASNTSTRAVACGTRPTTWRGGWRRRDREPAHAAGRDGFDHGDDGRGPGRDQDVTRD